MSEERNKFLDELLDSLPEVTEENKQDIIDKVNRLESTCEQMSQEVTDMVIDMGFQKGGPTFVSTMLQSYCSGVAQLAFQKIAMKTIELLAEQCVAENLEKNPNLKGN